MKLKHDDLLQHSRTHDLFVQPECGTIYTTSTKKNAITAALIAEFDPRCTNPKPTANRSALFPPCAVRISTEEDDSLKLP